MFTRRDALIGLAIECVTGCLPARAAPSDRIRTIGLLWRGNRQDPESVEFEQELFAALRRRGWTQGANLHVVRAYAEPDDERLPALARELVRQRVDLIVTDGHTTTVAAARATRSIPIVFAGGIPFAVEQGLIESFARPGRNVTGATFDPAAAGKRTEYLRQLLPRARRLAVLSRPDMVKVERVAGGIVDTERAARQRVMAAGFEPRDFLYADHADLTRALEDIERWGADAVSALPYDQADALRIIEFARRRRLPTSFMFRRHVEAGGLLSFGPVFSLTAFAEAAATYVDRILRGALPATLPVEMPNRWELVINATTAEALGLSIPPPLQVAAEIVR